MGAIKATSANGWTGITRRWRVRTRGRGVSRRRAETLARGKVSRNIRVSGGRGFYGTIRSSFLMEVPMEPKVSIIVPVYNAEKSLARCVDQYSESRSFGISS